MSLRDALVGMKEAKQDLPAPPPVVPKPQVAKKAMVAAAPAKTVGKSSNPDYEPVKLYVRKKTRKDATRKWEDADGGDFSELVEHLLKKYLST